ncbi:GTP-binding domain protein [Cooperia oncophora]
MPTYAMVDRGVFGRCDWQTLRKAFILELIEVETTLFVGPAQNRRAVVEPRTDVWPEPKPALEFDEKFLKLPSSDEYKRVRQFKIDEKGAVVSRGDSFRRKRNEAAVKGSDDKSPSPYPISGSDSARGSRSESVSSSEDSRREVAAAAKANVTITDPSTSHRAYKISVVGDTSTGKSSLIGQLITSEYKNAFADEIQDYENTVSICIGGQELDLIFFESDMSGPNWISDEMDAFVVVYSIDSRRSWKQATVAIEMIRESPRCKNSPIIVAGNKADLERKRTVTKSEVRAAAAHFGFENLEISVALDHDVDDLLVSLVAELKEAYTPSNPVEKASALSFRHPVYSTSSRAGKKEPHRGYRHETNLPCLYSHTGSVRIFQL